MALKGLRNLPPELVIRFLTKVKCAASDNCWLWTAGTAKGYGQFNIGKIDGKQVNVYAHRFAWVVANGDIPDGLSVLHRCDTPLCCNPDHLFLGTQQDNLNDARQKGRLIDGRGARKLSDAAYAEILARPHVKGSGLALATKYGVAETTISRIRNGGSGVLYARGFEHIEPSAETRAEFSQGSDGARQAQDGSR